MQSQPRGHDQSGRHGMIISRQYTAVRFLLGAFLVLVVSMLTGLPAAATEGPPCCPCAGATVADPLTAARELTAGGILDDDSATYVRWLVNPGDSNTAEGAAALAAAGARPWMMLHFTTPAPVSLNVATLGAEIESFVGMVRQAPRDGHYQVIWNPAEGTTTPEEYALLLKQVSVAVAGADSGARIITAPQPADPQALRSLYQWEIATCTHGLAPAPSAR